MSESTRNFDNEGRCLGPCVGCVWHPCVRSMERDLAEMDGVCRACIAGRAAAASGAERVLPDGMKPGHCHAWRTGYDETAKILAPLDAIIKRERAERTFLEEQLAGERTRGDNLQQQLDARAAWVCPLDPKCISWDGRCTYPAGEEPCGAAGIRAAHDRLAAECEQLRAERDAAIAALRRQRGSASSGDPIAFFLACPEAASVDHVCDEVIRLRGEREALAAAIRTGLDEIGMTDDDRRPSGAAAVDALVDMLIEQRTDLAEDRRRMEELRERCAEVAESAAERWTSVQDMLAHTALCRSIADEIRALPLAPLLAVPAPTPEAPEDGGRWVAWSPGMEVKPGDLVRERCWDPGQVAVVMHERCCCEPTEENAVCLRMQSMAPDEWRYCGVCGGVPYSLRGMEVKPTAAPPEAEEDGR